MSRMVSPIGQRLDRLPRGKFHTRMLFLIGAGMFFDGFDIYLAAGVLGALVREGLSDVTTNAWFISATFAGMTIGAWFAGILGDRFGRRFSYQFNLAVFGLASLAAACAPSITWLSSFRFIMGLGLGAEIVVGYGTLTEFMPPQLRGRFAALLNVFTNSALLVATFGGFLIIPYFGWRWMFAIAGIGAGIVWLMRKNMPESPRWLESKGRFAEADQITRHIEQDVLGAPPRVARLSGADAAQAVAASQPVVPLSRLFAGSLLPRTITGIVINVVNNLITHGFITWMPTFFIAEGLTVTRSLGFTAVMTSGCAGRLADWLLPGRQPRPQAGNCHLLVRGAGTRLDLPASGLGSGGHGDRVLPRRHNLHSGSTQHRGLCAGTVPDRDSPARRGAVQHDGTPGQYRHPVPDRVVVHAWGRACRYWG